MTISQSGVQVRDPLPARSLLHKEISDAVRVADKATPRLMVNVQRDDVRARSKFIFRATESGKRPTPVAKGATCERGGDSRKPPGYRWRDGHLGRGGIP